MKMIPSSRRHHYVAIVSIFLIAVALVAGMTACGPTAVTFADPDLETAVREAIAIPEGPVYSSDLHSLTSLNATLSSIADLTGLEYCTNLTYLNLAVNDIDNIAPLANLTLPTSPA